MRGEHAQGLGWGERDGGNRGEKIGDRTGRKVEEKKREMVAGAKLTERMGDGRMRNRGRLRMETGKKLKWNRKREEEEILRKTEG